MQVASAAEDRGDATTGAGTGVNPGVLMTLAMAHGYKRLELKPGIAVAYGERPWRTFTRCSDQQWLTLAAVAARPAWGDDPMVHDLV
jgi:hypothetical protein